MYTKTPKHLACTDRHRSIHTTFSFHFYDANFGICCCAIKNCEKYCEYRGEAVSQRCVCVCTHNILFIRLHLIISRLCSFSRGVVCARTAACTCYLLWYYLLMQWSKRVRPHDNDEYVRNGCGLFTAIAWHFSLNILVPKVITHSHMLFCIPRRN